MDPFARHGLPPNSALSSLPPLPRTPFHPRSKTCDSLSPPSPEPVDNNSHPSQYTRTPSYGKDEARNRIVSPWRETVYPILTARQGAMNVPRPKGFNTPGPAQAGEGGRREWKTPSRSTSAGNKAEPTESLLPTTAKQVDLPSLPPVSVPAQEEECDSDACATTVPPTDNCHAEGLGSTPHLPSRAHDPQSAARIYTEAPRTGGMTRSAALRWRRDLGMSLEESPTKSTMTTSAMLPTSGLLAGSLQHSLDQSPLLPVSPRKCALAMDDFVLSDHALPVASASIQQGARKAAADTLDQSTLLPESPHKWMQMDHSLLFTETLEPPSSSSAIIRPSISRVLDQSTLLPVSPHKWMQADQTLLMAEPLPPVRPAGGDFSGLNESMLLPISPRPRKDRAMASRDADHLPPTVSRTFKGAIPDQSVMFPASPRKMDLEEQSMLMAETMDFEDDKSMRLTLPMHLMQKTPKKGSRLADMFNPPPAVIPSTEKMETTGRGKADDTLDLGAMMAKLGKPRRASVPEESVADLLHADLSGDMDASVFIPLDLRPALPKSFSSRTLSATKPGNTRRRSNSLSDVPPAASSARAALVKRSPAKTAVSTIPARQAPLKIDSPTKMTAPALPAPRAPASRPSSIVGPSTARSGLTRPTSLVQPPVSARTTISLSAGAVPVASSASIKRIDLPGQSATARVARNRLMPPASCTVSSAVADKRKSMAPSMVNATKVASSRASMMPPRIGGNNTAAAPRFNSAASRTKAPATVDSDPSSRSVLPQGSMAPPPMPAAATSRFSALPRPGPSTVTRPNTAAAPPRPAVTGANTRAFATDAISTLNRPTLPTAAALTKPGAIKEHKTRLSAAPLYKPTAHLGTQPLPVAPPSRIRTHSTPASTVAASSRPTAGRPVSMALSSSAAAAASVSASRLGQEPAGAGLASQAARTRTGSSHSVMSRMPSNCAPMAGKAITRTVRSSAPPVGGQDTAREIEALRAKIRAMQARQTERISK